MVVDSVEIVSFSADLDHVLVEGFTTRNNEFVGIVECSEISFEDERLVEGCCDL